jgi:hypothetical protein
MACDLQAVFGPLAEAIPAWPVGYPRVVSSSQTLPVPLPEMASDSIAIRKG